MLNLKKTSFDNCFHYFDFGFTFIFSLDSEEGIIYEGSGPFYPKDRMCSWLLDTHKDSGNISVRFVFREFETECGWDHFYIHDGDSVFSPLLAAYRLGLIS